MRKSIASVNEPQVDELCRLAEGVSKPAMKIAIKQMIADGELTPEEAQRVIGCGDRFKTKIIPVYKTMIRELATPITACLKSISSGKSIVIKPTTGKKLISGQKKLFPSWIDPNFENCGYNVSGEAKPEIPVEVFEMTQNANFRTMFGSFDTELDNLTLTQGQIIAFVEDWKNWLHPEGWATFFLFKVNGEFFVASVYRGAVGLGVSLDRFGFDDIWNAEYRRRVVVPQQALAS